MTPVGTSTALRAPALRAELIESRADYDLLAAEVDALAIACAAPVTARGGWINATLDALPDATPLGAVVRGHDGTLVGSAVAVAVPGPGADIVTSPAGPEHRAAMLATDAAAAHALADGLAAVLCSRPRGARLSLGSFLASDPAVAALVSAIPNAVTLLTDPIPVVERTDEIDVEAYLARGMRRSLRHARNRIAADGRTADLWVTADSGEILGLLPALEVTCRERDHARGRASALDDAVGRRIWRRRCAAAVADGCAELAVLRIDGELAAYVFGVVDGNDYRVLEGRLVTDHARYSPGRLLEAAVVQRMLDDPALHRLDWMTGVAPDRLLVTNAADRMVVLHAEIAPGRRHAPRAVESAGRW